MAAGIVFIGLAIVVIALVVFIFTDKTDKPYIFNKHTFEVHNVDCPCVPDMKCSNKRLISKEKRDKIIKENPESICGRCKSK